MERISFDRINIIERISDNMADQFQRLADAVQRVNTRLHVTGNEIANPDNAAKRNAEARFVRPKDGGKDFQKQVAQDRAAVAAKTAKLRSLRLDRDARNKGTAHPVSDVEKLARSPFRKKVQRNSKAIGADD